MLKEEKVDMLNWYRIDGNWHHCITFPNGERYVDCQIQTEHQREVDIMYNEGIGTEDTT